MTERVVHWHRRDWIRAAAVAVVGGRTALGLPRDDAVAQIRAKARAAQMQPFESSETAHFVGVGDAPSRQRQEALALCEAFAADYFAHFRAKGFTIDWPTSKLAVVILAGASSYAAFEHDFADEAVGGHFDLDANWLVTFDFGEGIARLRPAAIDEARINNTLTLVHETFHQLSFNTGLLDRAVETPLCVVEGLATYAETWRPAHRGVIGAVNTRRRRGLELAHKEGSSWLPLKTLLATDKLLDEAKTQQIAYAESSMLAFKLLRDPVRLPQLRNYLKALPRTSEPAGRVALAVTHFGDLDKLDRDIRR